MNELKTNASLEIGQFLVQEARQITPDDLHGFS